MGSSFGKKDASSLKRSQNEVDEAVDEEFQDLMDALREDAEKILREDEWRYRSSDEILGFKDNF